MMSKNSIVPFLKDYLIKFLTRPFLLDTNETGMLKQKYFLAGIFILSAEKQPIKLSCRKIE